MFVSGSGWAGRGSKRDGEDGSSGGFELAAAAADGVEHCRRGAERTTVEAESGSGRVEFDGGAGRETGSRQRDDSRVPILAPDAISGADPDSSAVLPALALVTAI